jgi:hypothetical protein
VALGCVACTDVAADLQHPPIEANTNPFDGGNGPCGDFAGCREPSLNCYCAALWL